jgi:drug/metabolite transporter (DMT)-like permease
VLLAYVWLGEPLGLSTVVGGIMVILGAEVVRRPQSFSLSALMWAKSTLPAVEDKTHV